MFRPEDFHRIAHGSVIVLVAVIYQLSIIDSPLYVAIENYNNNTKKKFTVFPPDIGFYDYFRNVIFYFTLVRGTWKYSQVL